MEEHAELSPFFQRHRTAIVEGDWETGRWAGRPTAQRFDLLNQRHALRCRSHLNAAFARPHNFKLAYRDEQRRS